MKFALIKDEEVKNVIVADHKFIEKIKDQYDEIIEVTDVYCLGPGQKYKKGKFIFPEEAKPKKKAKAKAK